MERTAKTVLRARFQLHIQLISSHSTLSTCKNCSRRTFSFSSNRRCKLTCLIENAEKCTKQPVQNATKNVKSPSSLAELGQYTAENALQKREDTNINTDVKSSFDLFFLFYIFYIATPKSFRNQKCCEGTV